VNARKPVPISDLRPDDRALVVALVEAKKAKDRRDRKAAGK